MKCPYCNQEIPDGSSFCTFCGQSLSGDQTNGNQPAEETVVEVFQEEILSEDGGEAVLETVVEKVEVSDADSLPLVEPEAPKGGTGKKIGITVAAILAVGALAFGATKLMPTAKDPKTVVIDAFKSVTDSTQVSPMDELFGAEALGNKMLKENAQIMTSLKLESVSDESLAVLEGAEIGITSKQDVTNKQYSVVLGAGYGDMNIANLEMYYDDKEFMFAIPEISDRAFSINYADDLAGQIANSPFLGQFFAESGVDSQQLQEYFAYINQTASTGTVLDVEGLWKRYKEGSKAIDDLKAAMTVEKGDKKDLIMDGKSQSCQGYQVTITKDALIQFLKTSREFMLADETFKSELVEYMTQVMNASMSYGAGYGTEMPDGEQLWKMMTSGSKQLITELERSLDDVTMNVYVDSKGRLAAVDGDTSATIEDETLDIAFSMTMEGGYSLAANSNGSVTFTADGDEIVFGYDRTGEYDKEKLNAGLNLYARSEDDEYSFNYIGNYLIADGSYDISADITALGDPVLTLTSEGIIQDVEKGKKITILIDNITLDVPEAYTTIELSGDYRIMDLEGGVDMPNGTVMDILAATEAEWQTVVEEAYSNVLGIVMQFIQ